MSTLKDRLRAGISFLNPFAGEKRMHGITEDSDPYLQHVFGIASELVTPAKAEGIAAVFGAVQAISESLAMVPVHLYRRTDEGRERDRQHVLHGHFTNGPNDWQTWTEFVEGMTAQVLLTGNAYAEIIRDDRGRVRALVPILGHHVKVERLPSGRVRYTISSQRNQAGAPRHLFAEDMLHLRDRSDDGLVGKSRLRRVNDGLATAVATQRYAQEFFKSGTRPSGVIEAEGPLEVPQAEAIKKAFDAQHAGAERAHRTALLQRGVKWKPMSYSGEDAQLLESRKYSTIEIAQIFRIPPPLLQDLTNANYSNTVELSRAFVVHTLGPWFRKWEASMMKALLTSQTRKTHFIEFQSADLLRHDLKSRFEAYGMARTASILTPNEIRRLENLNDRDGGDDLFAPLNSNRSDATKQDGK